MFLFITTVRSIPAPEVSTTEGNNYVSIIENFNVLYYFYVEMFCNCNSCEFYSSSKDIHYRKKQIC